MKNQLAAQLIITDDPYLARSEIDKALGDAPEFAKEEFAAGADIAEVIQALNTPSMLADRRFVVLSEIEGFSGDAQRALAAYLEEPAEDVSLVMVGAKASSSLIAAVKKAGRVIEAGRGKRNDLFQWLKQEVANRGMKVTGDAMGALVEAVGEERMALSSALEELSLALPGVRIGPDQVKAQFSGNAQVKVFGFIDAVASRNGGPALDAMHRLLAQGEAPQMLFWMLTRHFRMLLAAEGSPQSVAKGLGIPPWRAEKLIGQARKFRTDELIDAYRMLAESDRKIKNSEEPEVLTLEKAVVAIAGS